MDIIQFVDYKHLLFATVFVLYSVTVTNGINITGTVPTGANGDSGIVDGIQKIPIVRLPSNSLLKYTAYKDVSILHFRIPLDTRTAYFSFKAIEEPKGAFQRQCSAKDVSLHLKASSYPVISPENITFPKHFLNADERFEIYNLQFKSDGETKRITIDGPYPGNWFAVAFISWTDPNNDRIEQQGLTASCETLLQSEMSILPANSITLNIGIWSNQTLTTNTSIPINYKFFVPRDEVIETATVKLSIQSICTECPGVLIQVQSSYVPSSTNLNRLHSSVILANQTHAVEIDFPPLPDAWHYVDVSFLLNDTKNVSRDNETVFHVEYSIQAELQYAINGDGEDDDDDDDDNGDVVDVDNENHESLPSIKYTAARENIQFYSLLRQTYREFFMFDYDLLPDVNGTVPTYINLTSGIPAGFKFEVGDVYDIGGTLSFAVAMNETFPDNQQRLERNRESGAVAEKLVDRKVDVVDDSKTVARINQTIIVCMRLNEPGIPQWPDKCVYGTTTLPAASIINNTNEDTSTGLIHVPFPESGHWYVTLGLFCHGTVNAATRTSIIDSVKEFIQKHIHQMDGRKTACACHNQTSYYRNCILDSQCLAKLNESETLKVKECLMDSKCTQKYAEVTAQFELNHKFVTEQLITGSVIPSTSDALCTASAVFTISSSPCVAGRCGRYGRCYHYMSGGFVFSTCLCIKGYRGWDCTEDSHVPSSLSILVALLLLTLSNLLFIPSIYVAWRRQYYTESVIYFFSMFFSIFYHACDSGEDEYGFCLVKIGVLQFCDFYCGLLAIWVTLIAMAHIRQNFVSLFHMLGAILLAFGTELNKQSLWVFLAPALTGLCIISVSWGLRCRQTRKWFPSRKYLAIFLPIGMVLVMVGLVCYAFLQTRQNYHIVHSVWHMVMALSILCLLPSRQWFLPKC